MRTRVVDDLDLSVRPGELYALLGPNGAGKTTTLRMVAGLLPPDAGSIDIFGIDALADPIAAKRITAWLPDEPMLYDKLSPLEYLEFVAGLWGVERPRAERNAEELLEILELAPHRHARCEGFSRGMKQKVALAGALIHDPSLIMLDEPLTGLDAGIARQVKDLLNARVRAGATIILTTHILEVAERLADRIGILAHGRLVAEGTLAELKSTTGQGSSSLEDVFLAVMGQARAGRMTPRSGSCLWLVAHDLTLNWRRFLDMFGRLTPVATWAVCIAGVVILHLLAWPIVLWLVRLKLGSGTASLAAGAIPVFCILAWMAAQGLLGTARTLQERGGMDLLLASPLPVRLILASRLMSIAASSFGSVALLVLPVANMAAILDGPAWLAVYPTLLALALIGTVVGMAVAIGLFLWLDPRRARSLAQLCAALIGGAFLLAACRSPPYCPRHAAQCFTEYFGDSTFVALLQPGRGRRTGRPAVLIAFTPSRRPCSRQPRPAEREFPAGQLACGRRPRRHGREPPQRASVPAIRLRHRPDACAAKNGACLCRDHGVFAQLSLQIVYTVPLAVVLLRSVDNIPAGRGAGAGHRRHCRAARSIAGVDHRVGRRRARADRCRAHKPVRRSSWPRSRPSARRS